MEPDKERGEINVPIILPWRTLATNFAIDDAFDLYICIFSGFSGKMVY